MAMHKRGAKGTSVHYLDRATAAQRMPRGACAHFLATFADECGATHHRWVPYTTRFPSLFAHSCEALEHKLGWRLVEQGAAEGEAAASEGDEFEAAILFLLSLPCSLPQKAVAFMLGVGVKRLHKLLKKYYTVNQADANKIWPAMLEALPAGQLQRRDADVAHSLASGSAGDTLNDSDDESELRSRSSGGGRSTATRMRRASGALGARSAGVRKSAGSASKRSASTAAISIQSPAALPLVSNSICSAEGQSAAGPSRSSRMHRPVAGQGRGKDLMLIRGAVDDAAATVARRLLPAFEGGCPAAAGGGKHVAPMSPAVDLPAGQHRRYTAELDLLMKQAAAREKHKQLQAGASPGVAAATAAAWLRAHRSELQSAALALALKAEGEGCGGLGGGLVPDGVEGGPPFLPTISTHDSIVEADYYPLHNSPPPDEWLDKNEKEQENGAPWALDPALQPAPPPAPALRPAAAPEGMVPLKALPGPALPVGAAGGARMMMAMAPPLSGGGDGRQLARDPSLGPADTVLSVQSCDSLWEQGLPPAIRCGQNHIMMMDCDE